MQKMNTWRKDLTDLDMKELKELRRLVAEEIKYKAKKKMDTFRRGQKVKVVKNGRTEFKGVIVKVKRTRVDVEKEGTGQVWVVPATMIEVIA